MNLSFRHVILVPLMIILLIFSSRLFAQQIDEAALQALVKEEVNRLINSEGVLDEAIEKGINEYISKQQQAARQSQVQQQQQRLQNLTPVDINRDHIFGKQDAAITLLEYSDFECPYCKIFHPTVVQLLENNKDKVRWVYRHFPLDFHNPGALKQAEGAECIAELRGNDAFWVFADFIYQRTESNGKGFPLDRLGPLAEEIGADSEKFNECLDSGRMAERVNADIESGKRAGVSGTPTAFLINRNDDVRIMTGALSLTRLQELVDELSNVMP